MQYKQGKQYNQPWQHLPLSYAFILVIVFFCSFLFAQNFEDNNKAELETQVAILCYHDFSDGGSATETTILTDKFQKQLTELKRAGVHFLTLEEFKQWKLEGAEIPNKSVLITIDDGWSSVYKEAYPILLKEDIPFTLFIYSNYLNRGGRSLSKNQLLTMLDHKASLGSHSHTHPLPPFIKEQQSSLDEQAFDAFIKQEFKVSKDKLEQMSKRNIDTYAYPGGYFQSEMFTIAEEAGYQLMFSVEPDFVTVHSANKTLPRFIIHGNNDNHFRTIIRTFNEMGKKREKNQLILSPEPESFTSLTPELKMDLSMIEGIQMNSIKLEILGLGPAKLDVDYQNKIASWKSTRRLYQKTVKAKVSWVQGEEAKSLLWTFYISDKP